MTPEDATTRIAEGMGALAYSLETLTLQVQALAQPMQALLVMSRRLGYMIGGLYLFLALALCGIGALAWQGYALHRANQDLHQQTRTVVQTNQALLSELLGRTPRTP